MSMLTKPRRFLTKKRRWPELLAWEVELYGQCTLLRRTAVVRRVRPSFRDDSVSFWFLVPGLRPNPGSLNVCAASAAAPQRTRFHLMHPSFAYSDYPGPHRFTLFGGEGELGVFCLD